MSRWMHRPCDTILAARESELRESNTRTARLEKALDAEIARGKRRLDQLTQMGGDLLDTRINAHIEREAAASREAALLEEIDSLHSRINDLEEEGNSHQAVLEARRRKAAEEALGGAWDGPRHEDSPKRAQVAQALMTLPLASYDVTLAYQRDGNGDWYWTVDGVPVNPYNHSQFIDTSPEDVLTGRFGFTNSELSQIRRDAENAHHQMQDLTSKEF